MLRELRIRALGVIEDAVVEFGPGLNVVTGETGAGKTMVVQGLGLLFGARADPGLVRAGADAASVDGLIEAPAGHPALDRAEAAGADIADGLILARIVGSHGRSRAVAGGRTVPAGVLAELAEDLVVVHGQSDQWRLRSTEEQRGLLDAFGGDALAGPLAAYRATFTAWRTAAGECTRLETLSRAKAADLAALRAGVERIETVDPLPGEDLALRIEDERLGNAEALRGAALAATTAITGDESGGQPGALDLIAAARAALAPEETHDPDLADLLSRLAEIAAQLSDLGSDLARYAGGIDLDGERLAAVQQRRAELRAITRDFGGDVAATLAWLAEASARLHEVDTAADQLVLARDEEQRLRERLAGEAGALSDARTDAAAALSAAVTAELAHLAMGAAAVTVTVGATPDPDGLLRPPGPHRQPDDEPVRVSASGCDDVEFRFRSTPDVPWRPLTRSASGGELSRVMLAIEVALGARVATVPTYVFDEVDAGVGGKAALDVGARLARLAATAQVIVVTHLPQVAAFADRHLVVTKERAGQVTASGIRVLAGNEIDAELARMMAGADTAAARKHAAELRRRAGSISRGG